MNMKNIVTVQQQQQQQQPLIKTTENVVVFFYRLETYLVYLIESDSASLFQITFEQVTFFGQVGAELDNIVTACLQPQPQQQNNKHCRLVEKK